MDQDPIVGGACPTCHHYRLSVLDGKPYCEWEYDEIPDGCQHWLKIGSMPVSLIPSEEDLLKKSLGESIELLRWLVNLASGVSKGGGEISSDEVEDANQQAQCFIERYDAWRKKDS